MTVSLVMRLEHGDALKLTTTGTRRSVFSITLGNAGYCRVFFVQMKKLAGTRPSRSIAHNKKMAGLARFVSKKCLGVAPSSPDYSAVDMWHRDT